MAHCSLRPRMDMINCGPRSVSRISSSPSADPYACLRLRSLFARVFAFITIVFSTELGYPGAFRQKPAARSTMYQRLLSSILPIPSGPSHRHVAQASGAMLEGRKRCYHISIIWELDCNSSLPTWGIKSIYVRRGWRPRRDVLRTD